MYIFPVGLELVCVRHIVGKRRMPYEVYPVALPLEFRGNHVLGVNSSDSECHQHRWHVDILESAAHGVLSPD